MLNLAIFILILAALFCIFLFLIAPSSNAAKKFKPFHGLKFAHRGLHGNGIPENSLEAFARAVNAGYAIELDVRLTRDGQLVVFHDPSTARMCGKDFEIEKTDYSELKNLRLSNTDQTIPLFSQVLELVAGKSPLLVEIKTQGVDTSPCEPVANMLDKYDGLWCVESFNPMAVRWFAKHRPHIARGQLSTNIKTTGSGLTGRISGILLSNLLTNVLCRPDFIAYDMQHRKNISLTLCRKIFAAPTAAWTLRGETEMKAAIDTGIFDSYIFEKEARNCR